MLIELLTLWPALLSFPCFNSFNLHVSIPTGRLRTQTHEVPLHIYMANLPINICWINIWKNFDLLIFHILTCSVPSPQNPSIPGVPHKYKSVPTKESKNQLKSKTLWLNSNSVGQSSQRASQKALPSPYALDIDGVLWCCLRNVYSLQVSISSDLKSKVLMPHTTRSAVVDRLSLNEERNLLSKKNTWQKVCYSYEIMGKEERLLKMLWWIK